MSSDGLYTQPNVFQQLMLQWERFAPYNAGQYFTLKQDVEQAHIAAAFRKTTLSLGLQQIGQHPDAPLTQVATGLDEFVTSEMNHRFAPGDSPLRGFVLHDIGRTHVGVIYRHVVADSASIRLVMKRWFDLIVNPQAAPAFEPVTLMRERFGGVWREHGLALVRETAGEVMRMSRIKQVRRLRTNDPAQPVVWKNVDLGSHLIGKLVGYARAKRVKVNDLFVAAAADACNRYLPHEESESRRDLAIGTIVDTRTADEDAHARFGLSLGVLQTIWRWQQMQTWETLLANASATAENARRREAGRSSQLRIAAAVWHGNRQTAPSLATFYRKRCPLSAGISNVNLNRGWPARHHPDPLVAYTRVSPLGPMLPIVFTPTTLGETLTLGYTYRSKIVPDSSAQRILSHFVERLGTLA